MNTPRHQTESSPPVSLSSLRALLQPMLPYDITGRVTRLVGLTAAVASFPAPIGSVVRMERDHGEPLEGEVVGFRERETLVQPYGSLQGVRRGTRVRLVQSVGSCRVGSALLGRVLDGRGRVIDGGPAVMLVERRPLHPTPIAPLSRPKISDVLATGLRAIDGFLTCGRGQRLGIFAGSGVGKSTLLGQLARNSSADVNVVVLIGERGREVREFLDHDLGTEGLKRSVVVVATGDDSALLRLRAAWVGTAIAEYFRDQGQHVLLLVDSLTRFALAQREIGLAAGEPPTTRGYPPSVFTLLPRLLERSGCTPRGSITGFYTVLVEGDDPHEPISDTVRGILDGHVWLSRLLAQQGHFPAIDVLASLSRLMNSLVTTPHREAAVLIRRLLAAYQQAEDLIQIGAYQRGSNPVVDLAQELRPKILQFLQQTPQETSTFEETIQRLLALASAASPADPSMRRDPSTG
ncbi:MAG: EscN/YscN/HrcN family type III secretion system ATPase [Planctomycetaceae bacterium]|nr:MAG: EscN/YscN/HrcN family type III secretion system ATPase [Planctomycetaceae bacterium]